MAVLTKQIPEWKTKQIDETANMIKNAHTVAVVDIKGLPGRQFHNLRAKLRKDMNILVRKKIITGSSKTTPKANRSFKAKPKYCFTDGRAFTYSFENPMKNLNPNGKTTKYPKSAPPINRIVETRTNGITSDLSCL